MSGGKIPQKSSHSVIDKPESVSLVKPPTIIVNKTKTNDILSQYINKSSYFLLCEIMKLIYIYFYILIILKCRYGK